VLSVTGSSPWLLCWLCRWTGIFAYSRVTNQQYKDCVSLRTTETGAFRIATFFGDCGTAPNLFPTAPTTVCLEAAGEEAGHCGVIGSSRKGNKKAPGGTNSSRLQAVVNVLMVQKEG